MTKATAGAKVSASAKAKKEGGRIGLPSFTFEGSRSPVVTKLDPPVDTNSKTPNVKFLPSGLKITTLSPAKSAIRTNGITMTTGIKIYARHEGNREEYSFRRSELIGGVMGAERPIAGILYVQGTRARDFNLMPRRGEEPTDAMTSPPLEFSVYKRESGDKRAWTADEAVEKTRGTNQSEEPVFVFVPATQ